METNEALATRRQALVYFALACACAVVGFIGLFKGGINMALGAGVAIMGFSGFLWLFERAWATWDRSGSPAALERE